MSKFKYIPFEFRIQNLLDLESESQFGQFEYEIANIVSYFEPESKFQIINRNPNDTWTGYADGYEFNSTHSDLCSMLISKEGNSW